MILRVDNSITFHIIVVVTLLLLFAVRLIGCSET